MGYGDRVRALLRGCWLAFGRGISRPGGAKAYMANAVVRHRCALGPGPGFDVAPGTHRSVGGRERTRPRAGPHDLAVFNVAWPVFVPSWLFTLAAGVVMLIIGAVRRPRPLLRYSAWALGFCVSSAVVVALFAKQVEPTSARPDSDNLQYAVSPD